MVCATSKQIHNEILIVLGKEKDVRSSEEEEEEEEDDELVARRSSGFRMVTQASSPSEQKTEVFQKSHDLGTHKEVTETVVTRVEEHAHTPAEQQHVEEHKETVAEHEKAEQPATGPEHLSQEEIANKEQEARAQAEQERRAAEARQAQLRAQQEALQRAQQAQQEAQLRAQQEAQLRAQQAQAQAQAQARAQQEALERAKQAQAQAQKEAQQRAAAQAKAQQEAQAKAQKEAQMRAEQARAQQEAQMKAQQEAQRKAKEAQARAQEEARRKAEQARAQQEAQRKAQQEAQARARQEAQQKARLQQQQQQAQAAQRPQPQQAQRGQPQNTIPGKPAKPTPQVPAKPRVQAQYKQPQQQPVGAAGVTQAVPRAHNLIPNTGGEVRAMRGGELQQVYLSNLEKPAEQLPPENVQPIHVLDDNCWLTQTRVVVSDVQAPEPARIAIPELHGTVHVQPTVIVPKPLQTTRVEWNEFPQEEQKERGTVPKVKAQEWHPDKQGEIVGAAPVRSGYRPGRMGHVWPPPHDENEAPAQHFRPTKAAEDTTWIHEAKGESETGPAWGRVHATRTQRVWPPPQNEVQAAGFAGSRLPAVQWPPPEFEQQTQQEVEVLQTRLPVKPNQRQWPPPPPQYQRKH
ncbi:unnamed protein product [Toxocara canis]|uniref:Reticulocyte-binding protein 2-like protein a n=1 Tax=Toxocara canis TaxID=6265 RepID=A0A183UF03_TOXCA|nr:unnamed protein product [Toxocara canis]